MISPLTRWALKFTIALVWLYQGLWNKFLVVRVFAWDDRHLRIMQQALGAKVGDLALYGLAGLETLFALAILVSWRPLWMAGAQISLLLGMNAAGILFAASSIPDVGGMLTMNAVFCVAIWIDAKLSPGSAS
jgi:hypothetical protein